MPGEPEDGRIVGVGASAGGLESLEQLFASVPADSGMAFVVVQHLSPDFRSLMDELIGRITAIPVVVAEDGMPVEPDHIYLMPPRKEMIIRDRRLWLADKEPHTFSLPIDGFFRSLAQDVGAKAVAIVLSGSGSDGSRGVIEIKRAGGVVMIETPTSAKFDGMPLASSATGVVDHAQSPSDLARILCGLPPVEAPPADPALSDDPALDGILRLLRDSFGIDFSLYKTTTVGRRIGRRVEILRLGDLAAYVDYLRGDPDELDHLYHDLLIGVTQFFRDAEAFAALEHDAIPRLLDLVKPDEELRVWIAGCATGEEAYSLAMLFAEAFAARQRPLRIKILATDVHQRSLDVATAGIYGEDQLVSVSPERLEKFFVKRPSGYQVASELRQLIVFARHNVTKDPPFTKMHFISCRNMLIYFQPQAQRTVLTLFHFGLTAGGMLFLGASESPGSILDEFSVVDEHWKIYRKRRDVQLLGQVRLPIRRPAGRPAATIDLPRGPVIDPDVLATYDQLLDLFMPPGLLVDDKGGLLDAYGGAEKLLRVRRRRPTGSVLELFDDEVRVVISGAIQRALKDRQPVAYAGVRFPTETGDERRVVTVHPLVHPRTGALNVLITLRAMAGDAAIRLPAEVVTDGDGAGAAPPPAAASGERMQTLERELQYTRETLQSTIEQLETSNEEMQATNEELIASNEELQSTNEELHSVNEELFTVNAEYQQKIAELREANADINHLLEGTDVGTVFLDRDLRIRRFTTKIARVFRFQPSDVGRRIDDFSHNIERPGLLGDIEDALRDGTVVEDEVRDRAGTPYFLRILPYSEPVAGVVLTLTDLTSLEKERTRAAQLSAIVEWSDDAILAVDLDGAITSWNRGAERCYGYTAEEVVGKNVAIVAERGTEPELRAHLERIVRGEQVAHATGLCRRKDGTAVDVSVGLSPIYHRGKVVAASVIARDISGMVAAQRALEAEQTKVTTLLQRREQFLAMLSHELRNPLAAILSAASALERDDSPEIAERCHAVIKRQGVHMKRLLDDLLDVSRITSDKFMIEREDLDLRDAVETAIETTAHLFRERDIRLDKDIAARPVPVTGDGRRLTQVVANLLANAAVYSPANTRVRLTVGVTAGSVVIRVRDQGDGVATDLQGKIFDLFVQSEQKLDRPRGGLGVGLSLARTIVERHGGTIGVHSAGTGTGSEFEVALPLGTHAPAPPPPRESVRSAPCRIVVVDDQEDSREMLRLLFEARKHEVHDASDGAAALQLITQLKPDVAFIDIGLPVMNGFEVAEHIRKHPDLKPVRLIALSGYGDKADIQAAIEAGFDEHVTKPAKAETLERILAKIRPGEREA
jgi:two-component system, chemotaxis family, CheB/CheR fusion protein